jgi:hexokinase
MGKAFKAENGLLGDNLGDVVQLACKERGLNVQLQVIVNDSSACLLSRAYTHPSTRLALILGTGFNIAAYLPSSSIDRAKFGVRPDGWFDMASHVIVNTEFSMFGGGILPLTRWDHQLLKAHPRPHFQPMEHLVSGMYLGEICRYALIDAINTTGVFGGIIPASLKGDYSLGSDLLSKVEA